MVAKRLAPLVWFTKNGKKHIRLRGLPDAPAIPLIDRKRMTALAAVGLTIGTFLEVDCATDSKNTKDAPLLTYTTDKDPFLVFPCTVTKDTDTTTGYSTVSRTRILHHNDSKRATLQFFSSLPIQPGYILDGST